MGDQEQVAGFEAGSSPFDRIIGLDWYDGLRAGMAQVGKRGPEYRFDLLDEESFETDPFEIRIVRLARLPNGSLDRLDAALSPYESSQNPFRVPLWRFPTADETLTLDQLLDELLRQSDPATWVIASADLTTEIRAARPVSEHELASVNDWFAFLGLERSTVMS